MEQAGLPGAPAPRDLQPRYVRTAGTASGESLGSPRPLLHEVADAVCLHMDMRTSAQLGEAWSRGAAAMQRARQSQKSEMVRMQAEVSEQVASVHRLTNETRELREGLEAVLRNLGALTAQARDAGPPEGPCTVEQQQPAAPLAPQGATEAVDDASIQTANEQDPSDMPAMEAVAAAAAAAPPAPAPPAASAAPAHEAAGAAALRARAAVLRAAAGEARLLGAARRLPPAARREAVAPLLAPMPTRPVRGVPAWLAPLAPCPEEPDSPVLSAAEAPCQGSSRASTPSTTVGVAFSLTLRRVGDTPFGLEVQPDFCAQCLVISGVRPGSVCEAWNRQNLGELRQICVGDRIVAVNEAREAEAMRDEFRSRLTVKVQVERGELSKSSPSSSAGTSTGRSTPEEAALTAFEAEEPAPTAAPDAPSPSLAGPPGLAKPAARHGRVRGRGRRGRGGKA